MKLSDLELLGALSAGASTEAALDVLERPDRAASSLPLVGRVALGIGAWLAGVFLVGFFAIALGLEEGLPMSLAGFVLAAGGVVMLRLGKGIFVEQLGLALGLCGHLLLFAGLFSVSTNDFAAPFVAATVVAAPVYWWSRHPVQRYFSALWPGLTAWGAAVDGPLAQWVAEPLIGVILLVTLGFPLVLMSGKARFGTRSLRPAIWASLTVLFAVLLWINHDWIDDPSRRLGLGFGLVAAGGFGAAIWNLVRPTGAGRVALVVFCAVLAGLGAIGAGGVAVALGLAVVAHARGDRRLEVVAAVTAAVFLVAFYFYLGAPLVEKSVGLTVCGLVLLGTRVWLPARTPDSITRTPPQL